MSVPLSVALATARTYLNDDSATVWSDTVLIPKAQEAHRELQADLWLAGSPVVKSTIIMAVLANTATFSTALPTDLLAPIRLTEATVSTGPWTPMTEITCIADLNAAGISSARGATLNYWAWIQEGIQLVGATTARQVEITYRRLIPIPNLNTDLIGILFGELYIAPRVAAFANGAVGNKEGYDALTALAKANFGQVVAANRGSQRPTVRPS